MDVLYYETIWSTFSVSKSFFPVKKKKNKYILVPTTDISFVLLRNILEWV